MTTKNRLLIIVVIILLATCIRLTLYTDLIHPPEFKVLVVGHVIAPGFYSATPDTRIYQLQTFFGGYEQRIELSREPNNKFDPNAIQVFGIGTKGTCSARTNWLCRS